MVSSNKVLEQKNLLPDFMITNFKRNTVIGQIVIQYKHFVYINEDFKFELINNTFEIIHQKNCIGRDGIKHSDSVTIVQSSKIRWSP